MTGVNKNQIENKNFAMIFIVKRSSNLHNNSINFEMTI